MDGRRFDQLVKSWSAVALARRRLASAIILASAMPLSGLPNLDAALAKHKDRHDRRERKKRKNKKKNRCTKTDNQCNLNRPNECCSKKCCFDSTSKSNGTCPSKGGECCGDRPFGGYCPQEFPQCCGSNACCGSSQTCCVNIGGRGVCCNPGFVCTVDGSGCVAEQSTGAVEASGGVPRHHSGR